MATEELLQAEARERPRVAVAAGIAAFFTIGAPIVGLVALGGAADNLLASALQSQQHLTGLAVGKAFQIVGVIAIALVLDFLVRAARARNPQLPALLRPLPWLGGIALAIMLAVLQVVATVKLNHFANEGTQTYDEAKAVTDYGAIDYFAILAQLVFAFAFVAVSVSAMRAGLLTRFLGYLGLISGILFVFPVITIPIVQVYWLGMVAMLLSGRAPGGMPPAWQTGEAVPWPSSAELREARVRAAEERRTGGEADIAEPPQQSGAGPSPATSRRKRKKRR
ncbi:MAG: hypothetical protein WBD55_11650 [Dehalococcoidia bacterium]